MCEQMHTFVQVYIHVGVFVHKHLFPILEQQNDF